MRRSHILTSVACALGLGLALTLLWLLGVGLPIAQAVDRHVCVEGPPTCDYYTIQEAVDASGTGDLIKVAAGTYTTMTGRPRRDFSAAGTVTQVVYISRTVIIQGGYTTTNWGTPDPLNQPTILDAQNKGRVIYITGNISPTIEGLRLTGGTADGLFGNPYGNDAGSGVYIITATATLSNNQVYGNRTNNDFSHGGGFSLNQSKAILNANLVASNTAAYGGGLYLYDSDATLYGNRIAANTAALRSGGGLYLYTSNANLSANTVISNATLGYGGGLVLDTSDASLSANIVISNYANNGGGMTLLGSNATLINTVVANNRVDTNGAGLYVYGASPLVLHATIALNSGAGDQTGVYVFNNLGTPSNVVLTNTIIANQRTGIYVATGTTNTAILNGVLWYGNTTANTGGPGAITVTDDITGNPAFVGPAAGNFHLGTSSSAIDAGVSAGVATDLDGIPRPQGSQPDLGAYEAAADLAISKVVVPASANPGDRITYTLSFANSGSYVAAGVRITDAVPVSVTNTSVLSSGVAITQASPGYVWTVQDLAVGQAGIITIMGVLSNPLAAGVFTNTATIASTGDSNPGDNSRSVPMSVSVSDLLTVTKAGSGSGRVTSTPAGIDCGATCSANFRYATVVTLTAVADAGSAFTGWSGSGCSGTGTCVVTMDAAKSVTATFEPVRQLTVNKAGAGTGTVTSAPAGINCGGTCSAGFVNGTVVTLTSVADAGSAFTGWSGSGCSGTGTCVVTMDAAKSVTATFELLRQLTVNKTGTGTGTITSTPTGITCGGTCSAGFVNGTIVTLTATAGIESAFTGWSEPTCPGIGTCVVTMTAAKSVTATFTLNTYPLTVTKTGTGLGSVGSTPPGIDCGSTCGFSFGYGTIVTLTATPVVSSTFANWSGGGCSGTGTCRVTINAARSVTATFNINPSKVPVANAGPDQAVFFSTTVTLNGSGSYDPSGRPLSYSWAQTQTHGLSVTFNQALSVTTFTAPGTPSVLTFTLVVSDDWGLVSDPPDMVVVRVGYLAYLPLTLKNYP